MLENNRLFFDGYPLNSLPPEFTAYKVSELKTITIQDFREEKNGNSIYQRVTIYCVDLASRKTIGSTTVDKQSNQYTEQRKAGIIKNFFHLDYDNVKSAMISFWQ